MELQDRLRRIYETNKFINVSTKLKNGKLGDDSAWVEAQPLLEYIIEGYPGNYRPYLDKIKQVFEIRRRSYFQLAGERTKSENPVFKMQNVVEDLKDDELDHLSSVFSFLRDFFEKGKPSKIHR